MKQMTVDEFDAHLLTEHPKAPRCKGCGAVLVNNENLWKRDGRDIYCSKTCFRRQFRRDD